MVKNIHPRFSLFLLVCALLTLPMMPCSAQQIETDRPDQTESSSVIPKRSMQLETGIQYGHVGWAKNREVHLLMPTALLRIGILKNIELRVVNQFLRVQNEELNLGHFGFSDVELGAKVQLLRKEHVNTEIAFISHVVLPVGNELLTGNRIGSINKLCISHALNSLLTLGYNLGYNYIEASEQFATYSIALGFSLGERLGFYIEPYGNWDFNQSLNHNLDGGFTYLLKDNIQLDASYGVGLNYRMHYAALGLSWNFNY